jgi:hypothetical protein
MKIKTGYFFKLKNDKGMGRYSRKDMIEFANFAKSYQSPKKVKTAYERYLKGQRIVTKNKLQSL